MSYTQHNTICPKGLFRPLSLDMINLFLKEVVKFNTFDKVTSHDKTLTLMCNDEFKFCTSESTTERCSDNVCETITKKNLCSLMHNESCEVLGSGSKTRKRYEINYKKQNQKIVLLQDLLTRGGDYNFIDFKKEKCEIIMSIKDQLTAHPILPMQPNEVLNLALMSGCKEEPHMISLAYHAVSYGVDLNIEIMQGSGITSYFPTSPLAIAEYYGKNELALLLKNHGAKCGSTSYVVKDFLKQEIFNKYPFGLTNVFNKININAAKTFSKGANKVPLLLYHIWFTHHKEISHADILTVIDNHNMLLKSPLPWSHLVLTNNKSLIPNSVSKLEAYGIEVKNIDEFRDELRLFEQIKNCIDEKLWGLASDLTRYSFASEKGGVYADLNFKMQRNVDCEVQTYDFFAPNAVNHFFGVKPHHPIFDSLLNKIEINLSDNPYSYIANIDSSNVMMKTVFTSLFPFLLSFIEKSNQNQNIDIIYPHTDSYQDDWLNITSECIHSTFWQEFLEFSKYTKINNQISIDPDGACINHIIGDDGARESHLTWMEL